MHIYLFSPLTKYIPKNIFWGHIQKIVDSVFFILQYVCIFLSIKKGTSGWMRCIIWFNLLHPHIRQKKGVKRESLFYVTKYTKKGEIGRLLQPLLSLFMALSSVGKNDNNTISGHTFTIKYVLEKIWNEKKAWVPLTYRNIITNHS